MILVDTVLCVKIHRKLQRRGNYNLEVRLVSDEGKKKTSTQQVRSNDVSEERDLARRTTPKESRSSVGDRGPGHLTPSLPVPALRHKLPKDN